MPKDTWATKCCRYPAGTGKGKERDSINIILAEGVCLLFPQLSFFIIGTPFLWQISHPIPHKLHEKALAQSLIPCSKSHWASCSNPSPPSVPQFIMNSRCRYMHTYLNWAAPRWPEDAFGHLPGSQPARN